MPEAAAPSAEDEVLLRVEHGDLAQAVDDLSPELRAVVQAVVLDGLTSKEAARLLNVPAGTVRTRLMRARTQLREALI
jgi:RNA polymerase sigma-70 factor (ECF subfamily)